MRKIFGKPALLMLAALLVSSAAQAAGYDVGGFMRQNKIDSIESALDWEAAHIRYETYGGRGWQSSRAVLETGRSSCQGFASINSQFLQRLGFRPAIYSFQVGFGPDSTRHAVVVFKNGLYFNAISNQTLISSQETDLQAFLCYLGVTRDYHFPVEKHPAAVS